MGKRVRFRGIKRTNKRVESDILEKSKNLWEDSSLLRPKCAGNCRKCSFDKTFKRIAKLDKIKSSADGLTKMASRGSDDIFKAYAATISLYASGTVPYTATAKLAGEDVPFVQKGAVGNDKLIGCQHYDDPKIRLLLYNAFAKKNKLYLYSFGEDLVCSNTPNMPIDYIYDTFWESPYEFPDDEIVCAHPNEPALVIKIKSSDTKIRICKNCAKDVSTLQYLISRIVAVDPLDDFEVYVEHNYHSSESSGIETIPAEKIKDYSLGKVTDSALIKEIIKSKLGDLQNADTAVYIIGNKNYGSNLKDFISQLSGDPMEISALSGYLEENPVSIVIQSGKASEALSSIWQSNYSGIISKFTSEEVAESIGDASRKNPLTVLKEAHSLEMSKDVVKTLPVFKNMGPVTKNADSYAKAVKVGGISHLKSELELKPPRDYKSRSLAKAFAIAVGNDRNLVKCTAEESDLAEFLVPFVKDLVAASGEEYRHKMNTLLSATGCGESV